MKKNRRTITVDGNKYVWWYGTGAGLCAVTISPFEDKTSRVRIKFQDTECDHDYRYGFTYPLYVELEKDRGQRRLKLIEPGMAALLTMYISRRELFKTRKEITLYGYELLADMGYDIVRIENGFEF
ncbi:MAG: hypothetical protein K2N46_14795 [Lachnospiraceae bacterium]|nr:hypothetical protein [Lachnospiraceae bacterium]